MTSTRFMQFVGVTPSRRAALTALLGGLPSLLLATGPDGAIAKKGKNKKPCKKCGRCQKCQNGKCKPVAAGAPCGAGKQCSADGRCVACDVCPSGCEFTSVQAAIDAAAPGDTIRLCAGSFDGPLLIREKDLTLIGAGGDVKGTTLDGRGGNSITVTVSAATVELKGMRITGSNGDSGVNNNFGKLTLTACTVSGNRGALNGGGIFNEGGELILNTCTVADNQANNSGGGIVCAGGTTILNNCTVRDNAADEGGGISVLNGALTLSASRVEGNTAGEQGGGLFFLGNNIRALTLNESTVSRNTPDDFAAR